MNSTPSRRHGAALLAGWVLVAAIAFAALRLPPDGNERRVLWQFIGRFHPVLVHAPIGFLLLVPVLEIAGLRREWAHLRAAAGFVLGLAAIMAIAAAADGWLLAWSGGYGGRLVTRHMWGGVILAGACLLTIWTRGGGGLAKVAYPVFLAGTVAVLLWTGHLGGELTQGESFLTERMPARLRTLLGLPPATRPKPSEHHAKAKPAAATPPPIPFAPGAPVGYAAVVPILDRSCVPCHRPAKHKGGLRMDTYALLMKGGEDGTVVAPGDPGGSDLIRRVTLPPDDDDFMPNDGKKPLSRNEIVLVERWIAGGAKGG